MRRTTETSAADYGTVCIVSTGQASTARQNVLLPALGLDGSAVSRITKITDLTDFALAINPIFPSILIFKARAADERPSTAERRRLPSGRVGRACAPLVGRGGWHTVRVEDRRLCLPPCVPRPPSPRASS